MLLTNATPEPPRRGAGRRWSPGFDARGRWCRHQGEGTGFTSVQPNSVLQYKASLIDLTGGTRGST